ncbi:VirB3 family type IV secretion system protein [Gymnodinialimonas sp. 2305UL16-5]|uniref:VirB3 family type IV secretion system protein n=1 Tax=Gymnodinialimonas mytili TaxID=3126503 RepID=UPI00309C97EB
MLDVEPFNVALTQSSRLFGLPYPFALPFFGGTVVPLIWSTSVWTIVWCVLVYAACRFIAEKDERIVDVFLVGSRAAPGTRSARIFGGHSYGP